jgi:epimerase transport system membrane fusion protein
MTDNIKNESVDDAERNQKSVSTGEAAKSAANTSTALVLARKKSQEVDGVDSRLSGRDVLLEIPQHDIKQVLADMRFYKRVGYLVSLLMFVGFFVWAALVPLKSAITVSGKIVTSVSNKIVQHPTGGVISELLVKEGDVVEKDQVLIRLSAVQVRSQLDIVTQRWLNAMLNIDRLRSERDDLTEIDWSPTLLTLAETGDLQDYFVTQKNLFKARRQSFKDEQAIYQRRIAQTRQQIIGLENLVKSQQKRKASIDQDLQDWMKLYEKRYTDKVKVRDMQRQLSDLDGDIASRQADLSRLNQSILETQHLASQRMEESVKEISEQLKNHQSQMIESSYQQTALQDELKRLNIVATGSGRVVGLQLTTTGGVVDPHKTLLQIVSESQDFTIVLKVKPTDIDQVFIDQQAEIKFTAFRINFMPVIYGKVIAVGADALQDEVDRQFYYLVKVEVSPEALSIIRKQGWSLVAGMPADAYLKTRERTLLSYIVRPFQLIVANAFNEDDGIQK